MSPHHYEVVGRACKALGIERVKLTGGEPLVREDVVDIVRVFSENVKEVSMTTNGFYLAELSGKLAEAGLRRVCVSLPSMRRDVFRSVTGVDALEKVLNGIKEAYLYGLTPITINTVVLKSFTIEDLERLLELASRYEARLRLIELEPVGSGIDVFSRYHRSLNDIVERLEARARRVYTRQLHARPVYVLENGVEVEIVAWFGNPRFCMFCDRVRLSPDGKLLPCIALRSSIDLFNCFKSNEGRVLDCVIAKFVEVNELREPYYKYE